MVFGIQYSVFGIQYSVFGFRFSVFGFGFRFSVFGFRFSVFGFRFYFSFFIFQFSVFGFGFLFLIHFTVGFDGFSFKNSLGSDTGGKEQYGQYFFHKGTFVALYHLRSFYFLVTRHLFIFIALLYFFFSFYALKFS
jgi:hypothetical protein